MPEIDQKEEIDSMLDIPIEDTTDEVIDDSTTEEVVDDVAGEDIIADAVGSEDTTIATDEPSATELAQAGGEPAAGELGQEEPLVESIDDIRLRIAEMSTPATPTAVPAEGDAIVDPLDLFKEDVPYITEENLAQIADNPLLLNAAMNNVRRQTAENLLSIVPNIVQKAIQENAVRTETHNAFYTKHKELVPYKLYVSSVAKDIQVKNPDKTQEEILDLVATSVKASLKIAPQKAVTKGKKPGGKPALRNASGGSRTNKATVPKNDMATQIAELL